MKTYAVVADTNGAHEAECVYSIWTTMEKAENEIKRLINAGVSAGCYGGGFHITEVAVDESSNEWIGVDRSGFRCDDIIREAIVEATKPLVELLKMALSELESCGGVDGVGDPIEPDQNVIKQMRAVLAKIENSARIQSLDRSNFESRD